jgi:enoyl-CoA hydratase/carnithine racemase
MSRKTCWRRRRSWRRSLAEGPTFAHGMTKTMLHQEWAMTLDQAIEAEAQAQAICMQTQDFTRAYKAFSANPCSAATETCVPGD